MKIFDFFRPKEKVELKETIDAQINVSGIPLRVTQSELKDSKLTRKTFDYFSDIYKTTELGTKIQEMVNYSIGRGIKIHLSESSLDEDFQLFLKREQVIKKMSFTLLNLLLFGNNFTYLPVKKDGQVKVTLLDVGTVQPEVSDADASNVEFFTVDYVTNRELLAVYYHILNYSKVINDDLKIDIEADYQSRTVQIEKNAAILHNKLNCLHNDLFGNSILLRCNEIVDSIEKYLTSTEKIQEKYRAPFLEITVPLAGKPGSTGVDQNIENAATAYKSFKIGQNIVHSDKENWKLHEFSPQVQDKEIRRGYTLYLASALGIPEMMFGETGNLSLATSRTILQMFRENLLIYQNIVKEWATEVIRYYLKFELKNPNYENEVIIFDMPNPLNDLDSDTINRYITMWKDRAISSKTLLDVVGIDAEIEQDKVDKDVNKFVDPELREAK